jgi:aldehyde dehydrogenase
MKYEIPGTPGSVVSFRSRYENFIGGQWTAVGVSHSEDRSLSSSSPRPLCHPRRSAAYQGPDPTIAQFC